MVSPSFFLWRIINHKCVIIHVDTLLCHDITILSHTLSGNPKYSSSMVLTSLNIDKLLFCFSLGYMYLSPNFPSDYLIQFSATPTLPGFPGPFLCSNSHVYSIVPPRNPRSGRDFALATDLVCGLTRILSCLLFHKFVASLPFHQISQQVYH